MAVFPTPLLAAIAAIAVSTSVWDVHQGEAPASARSIFPYSTFGFPEPIIGHQNQAYTLRGGRFAAVPGASEVGVPVDAALIEFTFRTAAAYAAAVRTVRTLGLSSEDYRSVDDRMQLGVRLRANTMQLWSKLSSLGEGDTKVYRFIGDCKRVRAYAHAVAIERSRELAAAAAKVLNAPVGPLVVQTDWAGASNDAVCGEDGSGDLRSVESDAEAQPHWDDSDPAYAYFWDSIYAAWTLGTRQPSIVSRAIVDRSKPVIVSERSGVEASGTATIAPDGYFYTTRTQRFTTTIVASKADAPSSTVLGNVVTDCDAAQQRSLANAVRVALLSGPVGSFYAAPARFLSIACLTKEDIGHTFDTLPTMYNAASLTGAAQVMTELTVYP